MLTRVRRRIHKTNREKARMERRKHKRRLLHKAMLLIEEDLGGADDHAFDWGVKDNLPGDGIEGHLIVEFVHLSS